MSEKLPARLQPGLLWPGTSDRSLAEFLAALRMRRNVPRNPGIHDYEAALMPMATFGNEIFVCIGGHTLVPGRIQCTITVGEGVNRYGAGI